MPLVFPPDPFYDNRPFDVGVDIVTPYQKEQAKSLAMVREHLAGLSESEKGKLKARVADYLTFRKIVGVFLSGHFNAVCTRKCFQSRLSACCSRDGIITFFADMVINTLMSGDAELADLAEALQTPHEGFKCVYLGKTGCLWRIKPIVCKMFLCDSAKDKVFQDNIPAGNQWAELERQRKRYTWPDRPVLFDALEQYFMDAGYTSPLMYLNNSPGLLRVKRLAEGRKDDP